MYYKLASKFTPSTLAHLPEVKEAPLAVVEVVKLAPKLAAFSCLSS